LRLDKDNSPTQLDIVSKNEIDSFADRHTIVQRIRTGKLGRALNSRKVGETIMIKSLPRRVKK
jgi:uncharacterized protein YerC